VPAGPDQSDTDSDTDSDSDTDPSKDIGSQGESIGLGPMLRRAWIGYQLRLDEAMAAAGFGERRFPDGRVLRLCSNPAGSTISAVGREIGITRQGATKVVAHLSDRGYVSVADSASSGREKSVTVTARGIGYLEAQRSAAERIEVELRAELGAAGFSALHALLDTLGGQGEQIRMRDYLQK
jgi:DNA-binding MarR family transcriptional regulator